VIFCLFTSISGILVFILILLNVIDASDWPIPSFFRTGGDFASGKQNDYNMPLYITLVSKEIFGISGLHRFNGLSHEPNVYAMFTTPAMFFLPYTFQKWDHWKKYLGIGVILFHLMLTLSITFYFVIIVLGIIMILRMTLLNASKINLRAFAAFFGLITIITYYINDIVDLSLLYDSLQSKFDYVAVVNPIHQENLFGYFKPKYLLGSGLMVYPGDNKWGLVSLIFYLPIILFSYFAGLKLFFSYKPESTIGLGLVCYLIFMLKTPYHVLAEPILIYHYFITALAVTHSLNDKGTLY